MNALMAISTPPPREGLSLRHKTKSLEEFHNHKCTPINKFQSDKKYQNQRHTQMIEKE